MKLIKQNVLVNAAGRACLSDIGFITSIYNEELTTDDVESSTYCPRWTAPEIFKDGNFSKQSDVFSFGFVAVEVGFQEPRPLRLQSTMPRYSKESYCGEGLTRWK